MTTTILVTVAIKVADDDYEDLYKKDVETKNFKAFEQLLPELYQVLSETEDNELLKVVDVCLS